MASRSRLGPASLLVLLPLFGCATNNAKVNLLEPDFRIVQTSATAQAARHITGGLAVEYYAEILNTSAETITLKRIQLESMGYGGYDLDPASRPFDIPIPANQLAAVRFWMPANISQASIVGADGPVTLRAKVEFDSAEGMFQKIYVQQVNAGRTGAPGRD